jgi:hypothetical protein
VLCGAVFVATRDDKNGRSRLRRFIPIRVRPSQVIDLSAWKINLPFNNQQVDQPDLELFTDPNFRATPGVQFTAPCGGQPQPGSQYARSELRELNPNGSLASWSTKDGTHVMSLTQRVTHLPVVKKQLVCGQIHSANAYLVMIELATQELFVRYKDSVIGVLDKAYQLGTYFDLEIRASKGFVDVSYNGRRVVHHPMNEKGCYFKAGCYVQSSTSTGDLPTAYGQVEITRLQVVHS